MLFNLAVVVVADVVVGIADVAVVVVNTVDFGGVETVGVVVVVVGAVGDAIIVCYCQSC